MTTLCRIELERPICENSFQSEAVVSTNAFGGKRTDFHERASGKQPLAYLVHMCGRCGYSGAERDFTDCVEVTTGLKQQVWKELAPIASSATMTGSEKYEAAAKVAEWQGTDARYVADLLLRAAWCCVGDLKLADAWFGKVADEVIDVGAQQWIVEVADQRKRDPKEWFS